MLISIKIPENSWQGTNQTLASYGNRLDIVESSNNKVSWGHEMKKTSGSLMRYPKMVNL